MDHVYLLETRPPFGFSNITLFLLFTRQSVCADSSSSFAPTLHVEVLQDPVLGPLFIYTFLSVSSRPMASHVYSMLKAAEAYLQLEKPLQSLAPGCSVLPSRHVIVFVNVTQPKESLDLLHRFSHFNKQHYWPLCGSCQRSKSCL